MIISKKRFLTITISLVSLALISVLIILFLPIDFKPKGTDEEIIDEMISRIEEVLNRRETLSIVSITPFMWDEGYLISGDMTEKEFDSLLTRKESFQELKKNEQRIVFYYKNKKIVDIIIEKEEINFSFESRKFDMNEDWFKIIIDDSRVKLEDIID